MPADQQHRAAPDHPSSEPPDGQQPNTRHLWPWVAAGAVTGGLLGALIGVVYPHWGPVLAVGAFPWVLGIEIGVPIGALVGGLAFLSADRAWFTPAKQSSKYQLGTAGAAGVTIAAALIVLVVGLVLGEKVLLPDTAAASGRVHWMTKNTSRFGDADAAVTSTQVAKAVFPGRAPAAVVLAPQDPVAVTAAAPLLRTVNGPLLLLGEDGSLPDETAELLDEWAGGRLQRAVVVGATAPDDLPELSTVDELDVADPDELFAAVNDLLAREGLVDRPTIAVGGGPEQLLPAAAWLVHKPSPIAWEDGGDYVYAGSEAVPDAADRTRVGASGAVGHALDVAQYRDADAEVGWGIDDTEPESWHNAIVANPDRWQQAAAGLPLAGWGKPGPLLWLESDGGIPRAVESFMWTLGPEFEMTPAEGPFNHIWLLGDLEAIPYESQGRLDYLQEMAPVQTQGPGISWVELIVAVWLILAVISALWVLFDALVRLPVPPVVKAAWFTSTLVLGPIGVALYAAAYRHRKRMDMHGMSMWERPMWLKAAVATSRSAAAGTFFMVLTSAFTFLVGSPIIPNDAPWLYWLGNNMVLTMIVVAYLVALVLSTLVFMAPLMRHHKMMTTGQRPSYGKALWPGFRNMAINMTVLTVFMLAGMWIWMQEFFQMGPVQNELFWWYALLAGVAWGVAAIYPVNWWLVATGRKGGSN